MEIALDYDDTYTRDPIAWDELILLMRKRGHYVYIVTWRNELECEDIMHGHLPHIVDGIYATDRKAKQSFMFAQGINIHVWIDDNPFAILNSMVPYNNKEGIDD
jgi:hypothetical protein